MRLLPVVSLLPLAWLAACGGDTAIGKVKVDQDGDGYAVEVDCDDTHATVNPDGVETCDGLDNDCNGTVDDDATDGTTAYTDADGDGHGDAATATVACDTTGLVTTGDDCDDADATSFPGGTERCDGADNDCNGAIDDAPADIATWYADADQDGYGDPALAVQSCDAPDGHVVNGDDCDDDSSAIHPDAPETDCEDPTDYNCDGSVAYADADGDGWAACEDCDDGEARRNPGTTEICDADDLDEDCDGTADDADPSATGATTWRRDVDGDGYATPGGASLTQCEPPVGYASATTDCDDYDPLVSPGAAEVCDPYDTDEDCDGLVDDTDPTVAASSWVAWYRDRDSDGYGETARSISQCAAPSGYVAVGGDCDDTTAARSPGNTEVCDAADVDEDCDGTADDSDSSAAGRTTWYADTDRDGYGSTTASTAACSAPSGYVATGTDCDDASASVNPGATEMCDASDVDEDCDGVADDADSYASGKSSFYVDRDRDGYGAGSVVNACDVGSGYSLTATDCDDDAWTVHPGMTETCDAANVDEDCDGAADDLDASALGRTSWYRDADGDGYGAYASSAVACDQPSGYVGFYGDCNDASASIRPAGTEICDATNVDEDCDGAADDLDVGGATGKSTFYRDADSDAYGVPGTTLSACDLPSGYATVSTDCNDAASSIHPGTTEVCDATSTDEDCDGLVNDADTGVSGGTWYRDTDADGYGVSGTTTTSCTRPTGYVATAGDCNDASASVSPAATEACDASNVDEDCDGAADDLDASASGKTSFYVDADADGYGLTASTASYCDLPASGYSATGGDCNDASSSIRPGGTEVCDASNADEDCDGYADDLDAGGATGKSTWYRDADSDGYGTSTTSTSACDLPAGYRSSSTDCDDALATAYPGATEVCANSIDEDCDGTADDGCVTAGFSGTYAVNAGYDSKIYGQYTGDLYGYALAAGDFNGDGRGDLIVGAPSADTYGSGYGVAYVHYGAFTTGVTTVTGSTYQYYNNSSSWGGTWGSRVWSVGDLGSDARDEVAIGAQLNLATTSYSYGYTGGDTSAIAYGSYDFYTNCYSMSAGGDFNARSGTNEVVCGRTDTNSDAGAVTVYSGLPTTTIVAYFTGESTSDYAGRSVAGGQDVDGDGYDDVVIGATGDDDAGTDAGAAYLVFAPVSSSTASPFSLSYADVKIRGAAAGDATGALVWLPGDVNDDGYADVAVASPGYDYGARSNAGAIGIFTGLRAAKGSASPPVVSTWSSANAMVIGEAANDGADEAAFGDVNGDGVIDILVGAETNDTSASNAGAAWLVYGTLSGTKDLASAASAKWTGTNASDALGYALAIVPDVNADGADEIALAAYNGDERGYTNYGAVWIWLGE